MSDFFWKVWSVLIMSRRFASFGKRSWIRRPLVITHPQYISIGNNCFIRDGARLEVIHRRGHQPGRLSIGNGVTIEQDVHIVACDFVVIDDDAAIAARCSIVDTTHPAGHPQDGNRARVVSDEPSFVHIGKRVFLGVNVVVLPNVRIGDNSIVGANSVVTRDIPANSIAVGAPARVIRSIE
ncbi:MAG: acyltransferase [Microbacteriaceae bacterium]|nr:MAG: acyltransferase [Microbacteriaceae bacterium]